MKKPLLRVQNLSVCVKDKKRNDHKIVDNITFDINPGEIDADFNYYDASEGQLIFGDAGLSRVGIGDATPVSKLDVGGDLNVQSHITASGNISSS